MTVNLDPHPATSKRHLDADEPLANRIHQIRDIVLPGARMQPIVVTKLTAPRIVPSPPMTKPMIHRSDPTAGNGRRVG
jgi:hypothetical protein